ncbi:MAG: ribonuclease III [Burkholderiaceae bacterium]
MEPALLEQRLGHSFRQQALLRQALTHRSFGQPNNERLEFLGDSVLNCAMATLLFERFPHDDEGDLSRLRAFLVKQQALHKVAQRLELGQMLLLGEGEARSGGARRPSILADALEAVMGAVYLDGGFEAARACIGRLYEPELASANPRTLGKDPKTLLQEALQQRRLPLPAYDVVATHGAAHNQTFDVECVIARLDIRVLGTGTSRRAAEQAAADAAFARLQESAAETAPAGAGKPTVRRRKAAVKAGEPQARATRTRKARTSAATRMAAADKVGSAEKAGSADKAVPPDKAALPSKGAAGD